MFNLPDKEPSELTTVELVDVLESLQSSFKQAISKIIVVSDLTSDVFKEASFDFGPSLSDIFKDPKMKLIVFTEHKDSLDFLAGDGRMERLGVLLVCGHAF